MKSNRRIALQLASIAVGMVMLAYASVPLYRLFCQVTGFGGTTQRADAKPYTGKASTREVTVSFDANTDPNLPWKFEPLERHVAVRVGENRLVAFRAENLSKSPTKGTATFNVTPNSVGKYFNKIQCFCFEEQQLGAGQKVSMPVSFYLDPEYLNDPETRDITNITLSYTFFSYESANKSKL
jgi:cytochrome c oxidase assembly protein subunit 11